jgi:glucokinase
VVNPDAITIGGGVSGAWDAFQESMNREMLARSFDAPARHVKIIKAELGDDAGLLGAARVAFTGLADAKEPMQANEGLRPRS